MKTDFAAAFTKTFDAAPQVPTKGVAVTWFASPVGPLLLASTAKGLCGLEFTEASALAKAKRRLQDVHGAPVVAMLTKHPILDRACAELRTYFAGESRTFTVPLDLAGTDFQQAVWRHLCKIPYGETRSYEDLAVATKRANACRAVGQANGRNPVAIIVPCHRVINKSGGLGGYGGELWRKEKLLALEGVLADE